IVFVNDVDRGYRVRLFLEQFGMRACVLNSELPQNSRYHIVQEFNRGAYDYIIATDEATVISAAAPDAPAPCAPGDKSKKLLTDLCPSTPSAPKKRRKGDADYGMSRGVDF